MNYREKVILLSNLETICSKPEYHQSTSPLYSEFFDYEINGDLLSDFYLDDYNGTE